MRRIISCALGALCALGSAACGDDAKPPLQDAGTDPPDAAPVRLIGCLDTPDLPLAPTTQLPCDLVPPGVEL